MKNLMKYYQNYKTHKKLNFGLTKQDLKNPY